MTYKIRHGRRRKEHAHLATQQRSTLTHPTQERQAEQDHIASLRLQAVSSVHVYQTEARYTLANPNFWTQEAADWNLKFSLGKSRHEDCILHTCDARKGERRLQISGATEIKHGNMTVSVTTASGGQITEWERDQLYLCGKLEIVANDATGWQVFSGISCFPCPYNPSLLHSHFISPSSALKTSLLRAVQISQLNSFDSMDVSPCCEGVVYVMWVYEYLDVGNRLQYVIALLHSKLTDMTQTALQAESRCVPSLPDSDHNILCFHAIPLPQLPLTFVTKGWSTYREAKTKFIFDPENGRVELEQKLPMSWHAFNEIPKFEEIPEYKTITSIPSFLSFSNVTFWTLYYEYKSFTEPTTWLPPFRMWSCAIMQGWEKLEIPKKTRCPASSGMIPTCENLEATSPGIKPSLPSVGRHVTCGDVWVAAQALLAGPQHFMTFDKHFFEFRGSCSYLLANDFVDYNFSLIISYDSNRKSEQYEIVLIVGKDIVQINLFEDANEIGIAAMEKREGKNFGYLYLDRKDMVKIQAKQKKVNVRSQEVTVNPQQLLCVCDSPNKLKIYLTYELASRPPCLFDDVSLRKGTKSLLMKIFESGLQVFIDISDATFVLGGGFLIHYVALTPEIKKTYFCKLRGGKDSTKTFYNIEMLVEQQNYIRRSLLFAHPSVVVQKQGVRKLPAQLKDTNIYQEADMVHIENSNGFSIHCNMKFDVCTIILEGNVTHTNCNNL
ncbi:hypothetical protein PR048_026783 [Dryococelus australis]|uniref:VWFD domain-containing protein n=1 Tax=Dryococelus australis TaxID=614101 RepID=A0ABQ9GMA5_9NEOP|nr:hypothetical protein PR048_026783 [Dryococelus australis]